MEPELLREQFRGVVPVQPCPYTADDGVDLAGLRENTEFLLDFADGRDMVLMTNGSNTEFYANSIAEQQAVVETVLEAAEGFDVPVVAGTGRPSTRETVEMTEWAEAAGVDGAMVVLPYYRQPSREQLYRHYETVAAAVDIGIVLYNNPFVSGTWADPDLLARLAEIDNFVGLKENTSSLPQYASIERHVDPADVSVVCGLGEEVYLGASLYGARGFVSLFANFAPGAVYDLYEAVDRGDYAAAADAYARFDPLFSVLEEILSARDDVTILPDTQRGHPVVTAVAKHALDHVGLNGGHVRPPMDNLSDEEARTVENAVDAVGIEPVA
jgi:4-hydroxy-tetrahydrodipicolinate synthase